MMLGLAVVHKIRDWLYEWSLKRVSNVMSPEEAALIEGLASGEHGGGMTMDEEQFKEFQRMQSQAQQAKAGENVQAPGDFIDQDRNVPCDLRDQTTLGAVLEAYYADQNPEKVASAPALAKRSTKNAQKLSVMLAEKYPDAPPLHTYCPNDSTPERSASSSGSEEVEPRALRLWELDPLPYQTALAFVAAFALVLLLFGAPLSRQPALASKIDMFALLALVGGASCLDGGAHITNSLVLAGAGCQLVWLFARQWNSQGQKPPPAPPRRRARADWYNY